MLSRHLTVFSLLVLVVVALAVPATASATWGGECKIKVEPEDYHCYGTAEWVMSNKGEEVKGLSSVIYTSAMYVPEWNLHEGQVFVSNEQWAIFPQDHGYWVEDGQLAGSENNCCSLHKFYAYDEAKGLHETTLPSTVEGYTWNSFTLEDPSNNGGWCERYGPSETLACQGGYGYPAYAKAVEVGAEMSDETKPENSGKDQTGVQHLNGGWYHWNEAWWYSNSKDVCVGGYEDIAAYINWSTC
jgi:hypothetical protein